MEYEASNEDLTDNHFNSTTHTRLVEPYFVVYNKNSCEQEMYNRHTADRMAYIVSPMIMWGDTFLAPLL